MKHLNVTKDEVLAVQVSYETNKFAAYAVLKGGHVVVFSQKYDWGDLIEGDEFYKYTSQWRKPLRVSPAARAKSISQLLAA